MHNQGGITRPPPERGSLTAACATLTPFTTTGRGKAAFNQRLRTVVRQRQPLFTQDGQHVLHEVIAIFTADFYRGIHAVPDLRGQVKGTDGKGSLRLGTGRHHRQAPHNIAGKRLRAAEDIAAFVIFQQRNSVPVTRMQDDARGVKFRFAEFGYFINTIKSIYI